LLDIFPFLHLLFHTEYANMFAMAWWSEKYTKPKLKQKKNRREESIKHETFYCCTQFVHLLLRAFSNENGRILCVTKTAIKVNIL
jgi:hypothetical protein